MIIIELVKIIDDQKASPKFYFSFTFIPCFLVSVNDMPIFVTGFLGGFLGGLALLIFFIILPLVITGFFFEKEFS